MCYILYECWQWNSSTINSMTPVRIYGVVLCRLAELCVADAVVVIQSDVYARETYACRHCGEGMTSRVGEMSAPSHARDPWLLFAARPRPVLPLPYLFARRVRVAAGGWAEPVAARNVQQVGTDQRRQRRSAGVERFPVGWVALAEGRVVSGERYRRVMKTMPLRRHDLLVGGPHALSATKDHHSDTPTSRNNLHAQLCTVAEKNWLAIRKNFIILGYTYVVAISQPNWMKF